MTLPYDRYLRYDELTDVVHEAAREHPELVAVEAIGQSHEGRDIWLVTITDASTGAHDTKPAMWVDANIHSIEVTASASALSLIDRLISGFGTDETVTQALRTRTFYIVPRVNPDGAEWALAESPRFRRSSTRRWPWRDGHTPSGLQVHDVNNDGVIRTMRIADPNGAWMPNPDEPRQMVLVPFDGAPAGTQRYRLLDEGTITDYDGFTIPQPRPAEGLDMNRNYPAGWGTAVLGSGDFPSGEPEIRAVITAMIARPNICGFNAYHTSGGVLLRPSSTKPDSDLPLDDVKTWKKLGERCTQLTGYPVHGLYEDFTPDKKDLMSGASDDYAYEHLGVFGWTTEYWDASFIAGAGRLATTWWYDGPTPEQELAVIRWCDEHNVGAYAEWSPFEHPQLGAVEIGGWNWFMSWTNPPLSHLAAEVRPHADFAIAQALAAPCIDILHLAAQHLGGESWRVEAGIANTGFLPTTVTVHARQNNLVLPLVAELSGAAVVNGVARQELGQLAGRSGLGMGWPSDGTPERTLASWLVRGAVGDAITVEVRHPRAGTKSASVALS